MRQLCRIRQGGVKMFGPQRRIAMQNLLPAGAFRKAIKDDRNGHSGPGGANLATANLRVAGKKIPPSDHVPMIIEQHPTNRSCVRPRPANVVRELPG